MLKEAFEHRMEDKIDASMHVVTMTRFESKSLRRKWKHKS